MNAFLYLLKRASHQPLLLMQSAPFALPLRMLPLVIAQCLTVAELISGFPTLLSTSSPVLEHLPNLLRASEGRQNQHGPLLSCLR